jgi:hypothetical protein
MMERKIRWDSVGQGYLYKLLPTKPTDSLEVFPSKFVLLEMLTNSGPEQESPSTCRINSYDPC